VEFQKRETIATAYLRAAHAYILISMPTGTSTIFGLFQAISALLVDRTKLRPRCSKLIANEKFASEFSATCYGAMQKELTYLCGMLSNQRPISRFT
jgi:hypothetical protein